MTSPLAIKLDRCLSQFLALQAEIERYEEIPARRSLLIVAAQGGGINTIAQNLSFLARACLSIGDFATLILEWQGEQHCFNFKDLQTIDPSIAQPL